MVGVDTFSAGVGLLIGLCTLGFSAFLANRVLKAPTGTGRPVEISQAIKEGAEAFLRREYTVLAGFVSIVAVLLFAIGWRTVICFLCGALISAATGYAGMMIAVRANVRTCHAARESLNGALRVAFTSGSVMGMGVVGCGILGICLFYLMFGDFAVLAGFGMGASSIALFARVGGGIYTKAADVGSDLVGKVEAGIPEDDPRNPGVIADNVGDNVGDVAGMGADLFESYVGSIIAAATLAQEWDEELADKIPYGVALPILIACCGILACMVGVFCVQTKEDANQAALLKAIRTGIFVSAGLVVVLAGIVCAVIPLTFNYAWCIYVGLLAGIGIGLITEWFTSYAYTPTQSIARAGLTGPATVVIQGLGIGMLSTAPPVLIVVVATLCCVYLGGVYGVGISAVGMLATLGVTLATDAYGPVADNAGGIAEMANLESEVREKTDQLDALGNTTAATGKGFAIGSAVLTALALLSAYTHVVKIPTVDLIRDVTVMPGVILGAMLPYVFAALAMLAVGKAAGGIIEEVRRQFREIKGLLAGDPGVKPEYAVCVDISTRSALREMILPGMLAVVVPPIVGLGFGAQALAGLLIGAISSGFMLAVMMANAGGAWDNSKKWIESGMYGGKRTPIHAACVVGDTVGDPFKDTAGPSLNILIKLMAILSLVLAPLLEPSKQTKLWWVSIVLAIAALAGGGYWVWYLWKYSDALPTPQEETKEVKEPLLVAEELPPLKK